MARDIFRRLSILRAKYGGGDIVATDYVRRIGFHGIGVVLRVNYEKETAFVSWGPDRRDTTVPLKYLRKVRQCGEQFDNRRGE